LCPSDFLWGVGARLEYKGCFLGLEVEWRNVRVGRLDRIDIEMHIS
jgi:hypothetical protein